MQEVMGWRQDSKARSRLFWGNGDIEQGGSRRLTKPKLYDLIGRTEIFSGFRRALCLALCVADSFGEHLAKRGLSLWRFAREGFCPCRRERYVGMPEGELNPDLMSFPSPARSSASFSQAES
jgi:hypothetical protein